MAQIEVFGYFLDFASLVFLDFAHNDRWIWCLVVFLQLAGPAIAFLFFYVFHYITNTKLQTEIKSRQIPSQREEAEKFRKDVAL